MIPFFKLSLLRIWPKTYQTRTAGRKNTELTLNNKKNIATTDCVVILYPA